MTLADSDDFSCMCILSRNCALDVRAGEKKYIDPFDIGHVEFCMSYIW